MSRPPILHNLFGLQGATAILVEVLATAVLMLHITALVLLGESDHTRRMKTRWATLIVLVPVVGPSVYLLRHRDQLRLPSPA